MHRFVVSVLLVLGIPCTMTKLVDSFSKCPQFFSRNTPPVIPGILEDSASKDQNHYRLICQEYKDNYRFATLYDTEHKIPVFSAYKYTGKGDFSRPKNDFRIEPELNDEQAKKKDYEKRSNIKMDCGHLFPSSHAADLDTAKSTFTLTNVVPQNNNFNTGKWNQQEEALKKKMDEKCVNNGIIEAYVLTGAIPGNNKMGNVNIPSHMWMALCCYNSGKNEWVSQAYFATNEEQSEVKLDNKPLSDLQNINIWFKNTKLFHDNCK